MERDVWQLIAVRDLAQFQTFVKMFVTRTGQLLNLASLGADSYEREGVQVWCWQDIGKIAPSTG